jgi:glucose/arabinose dehydrogenase
MRSNINNELLTKLLNGSNAANVNIYQINTSEFPYDIEIVVENLQVPWAMAISEAGNLYITERPGRIRVVENGVLNPEPIITFRLPFVSRGEGGLMGIVLDPDFSQNHYMYVMHSYTEGNQIFNRVVRLIVEDNVATVDQIILDKIPGGLSHDGGRIKIGPDQKLYIATGDGGNAEAAQDLTSLAGKILRINLDGSIPQDNPIVNSPIYSYGHRNPEGLSWNFNNIMYSSDHGQTAHDEINIILPGANYGWPLVEGDEISSNLRTQPPLIHSQNNTWAPSGIAYINQGPWQGKLLVATLRGEQLLVISLNEDGTAVTGLDTQLWSEYGRLREVIQAEDGSIYLTTSNRDNRGTTRRGDDKVIRLVPR